MTQNKLLELYQKLKDLKLDVCLLKEFMNYKDEEIENILNSKDIEIIMNIYYYLC